MVLEADPAGKGFLPMGCLDHTGYKMSDPKDFYQNFVLEVVPNKINHSTYYRSDLRGLANWQPRCGERVFNRTARNAINMHSRINVMYSKAAHARGKISRAVEIWIDGSDGSFWDAWNNAESGVVRPRFIAVPMPKPDEARYVWIDIPWPIRGIYLPVAQNNHDNMLPHCAYVQLKFTRLSGDIGVDGFAEDGNQRFTKWKGDNKYGLHWTGSPASLRIDIDMMYGTLLVPREYRAISNELACLQLHRWDRVKLDWTSGDPNLKYHVDWTNKCINDIGLPLDRFLSITNSVDLQYKPRTPSQLAAILSTLSEFALNMVPLVGPLLAYLGSTIIDAIEDPGKYQAERQIRDTFGKNMTKPMLETMDKFREKFVKKKSFLKFSMPTSRRTFITSDLGPISTGNVAIFEELKKSFTTGDGPNAKQQQLVYGTVTVDAPVSKPGGEVRLPVFETVTVDVPDDSTVGGVEKLAKTITTGDGPDGEQQQLFYETVTVDVPDSKPDGEEDLLVYNTGTVDVPDDSTSGGVDELEHTYNFDLFAEGRECLDLTPMFSTEMEEFQDHPNEFTVGEVPSDLPPEEEWDNEGKSMEAAGQP